MSFRPEFVLPDPRRPGASTGILSSVDPAERPDLCLWFAGKYAPEYGLRVSRETIPEITAVLEKSLEGEVDVEFDLVGLDGAACRLITTTDLGRFGVCANVHVAERELLLVLRGDGWVHAALLDLRDTREFHNALAEDYDTLHA